MALCNFGYSALLWFLLLLLLLLGTSLLLGDVIHLKNGNDLVGVIVEERAETVVIEVAFGRMTIARKEIASIEKSGREAAILAQAERLFFLGATEHALEYLQQSLAQNPASPALRQALAQGYLKAGQDYLARRQVSLAEKAFAKAREYDHALDLETAPKQIQQLRSYIEKQQQKADLFLERGQADKALALYHEILDSVPEAEELLQKSMAQAAVILANQYLEKGDLEQASSHYDLAITYHPELFASVRSRWLYARLSCIVQIHLKQDQWVRARQEVLQVLEVVPQDPQALFVLGMIWERQGEQEKAFTTFLQILGKREHWSGNSAQLAQARKLAQERAGIVGSPSQTSPVEEEAHASSGQWAELASPYFIVVHQNAPLAQKVSETLEYQLQEAIAQLAPNGWQARWPLACKVYLYPNKEMYLRETGEAHWSEGVARIRYQKGQLHRHSIFTYQTAPLLLTAVLPHELLHILYPAFLAYQKQLPLWLNEGLAITREPGFRKNHRLRLLRIATRKGEVYPLKVIVDLRAYPQEENAVQAFYAQSYSLTEFLLKKGGSQRMWLFCQQLGRHSPATALREVYGFQSLEELEQQWRKAIEAN